MVIYTIRFIRTQTDESIRTNDKQNDTVGPKVI